MCLVCLRDAACMLLLMSVYVCECVCERRLLCSHQQRQQRCCRSLPLCLRVLWFSCSLALVPSSRLRQRQSRRDERRDERHSAQTRELLQREHTHSITFPRCCATHSLASLSRRERRTISGNSRRTEPATLLCHRVSTGKTPAVFLSRLSPPALDFSSSQSGSSSCKKKNCRHKHRKSAADRK